MCLYLYMYMHMYMYVCLCIIMKMIIITIITIIISLSITKLLDGLGIWGLRAGWADTSSALVRPGWLDLASIGSIRLPLAPLLGRSGLEWLYLGAPGFLAGSIWLLCALLGGPTGSILLPSESPIDTISNKNRFAYR